LEQNTNRVTFIVSWNDYCPFRAGITLWVSACFRTTDCGMSGVIILSSPRDIMWKFFQMNA